MDNGGGGGSNSVGYGGSVGGNSIGSGSESGSASGRGAGATDNKVVVAGEAPDPIEEQQQVRSFRAYGGFSSVFLESTPRPPFI